MNQTPEQFARDKIDKQLITCGWVIQDKKHINLSSSLGVAITEYQTEVGPADYVLFVDGKPVGIIEAKKEEAAVYLTVHEEQSKDYAASKLKYLNNDPPASELLEKIKAEKEKLKNSGVSGKVKKRK